MDDTTLRGIEYQASVLALIIAMKMTDGKKFFKDCDHHNLQQSIKQYCYCFFVKNRYSALACTTRLIEVQLQ